MRSQSRQRRTSSACATPGTLSPLSSPDEESFAAAWRAEAGGWSFDEVNDLIDRHNRWYPAESRLPMDPKTRTYALVNGEDYRRQPLDAAWVLRRFPAELSLAR